jgi:hypothetical protein
VPPRESTDALGPLVDRANHLEVLIVSNLLGFLLTATGTICAAIFELHSGSKNTAVTPTEILISSSALYFFLSGYYYFMLAQFYACIITLIPHATKAGIQVSQLWGTLRVPSLGIVPRRGANIAMLLNAPLFPLAFSLGSILFFRLVVQGHPSHGVGLGPTIACLLPQVLICILMISVPFREFVKVTVSKGKA